jgi:hypothetical protein
VVLQNQRGLHLWLKRGTLPLSKWRMLLYVNQSGHGPAVTRLGHM